MIIKMALNRRFFSISPNWKMWFRWRIQLGTWRIIRIEFLFFKKSVFLFFLFFFFGEIFECKKFIFSFLLFKQCSWFLQFFLLFYFFKNKIIQNYEKISLKNRILNKTLFGIQFISLKWTNEQQKWIFQHKVELFIINI